MITKLTPIKVQMRAAQSDEHYLLTPQQKRLNLDQCILKREGKLVRDEGAFVCAAPVIVDGKPYLNMVLGTTPISVVFNLDMANVVTLMSHLMEGLKILQSEYQAIKGDEDGDSQGA